MSRAACVPPLNLGYCVLKIMDGHLARACTHVFIHGEEFVTPPKGEEFVGEEFVGEELETRFWTPVTLSDMLRDTDVNGEFVHAPGFKGRLVLGTPLPYTPTALE